MRISFLFKRDLLLCVKVCCLQVSLYSTCMQCPQRPEEGVRSLGAGLSAPFRSSAHFKNWVVCFFDSLIPEFVVSGVSRLSEVELALSPPTGSFFLIQRLFSFVRSHLAIVGLNSWTNGVLSGSPFLHRILSIPPLFSPAVSLFQLSHWGLWST